MSNKGHQISENHKKAKAYQREKQVLSLIGLVVNPCTLAVMALTPYSIFLRKTATSLCPVWAGAFSLYFLFFSLSFLMLDLPLTFYSGYLLEKRYDLSNHTLAGWVKDTLKQSVLAFVISWLLLLALYALIGHQPRYWWWLAWAGFAFFSYGFGKLFPVFIVPLFYRYGSVESEPLKLRISQMAQRFGLAVDKIHSLNLSRTTKKANAAFMGMGKTKRVVLSDTLLEHFSEDEIEVVLAHEIGHYRHRDIWRMFFANLILSWISFWLISRVLPVWAPRVGFDGTGDMAGLPLLLLLFSFISLVTMPLIHGMSRWMETRADGFALEATCNKPAFIASMNKLAAVNLADPDPHPVYEWFFYDHPAIRRRIEFAESYIRGHDT